MRSLLMEPLIWLRFFLEWMPEGAGRWLRRVPLKMACDSIGRELGIAEGVVVRGYRNIRIVATRKVKIGAHYIVAAGAVVQGTILSFRDFLRG